MKRTFLELLEPESLPSAYRASIANAAPSNSAFSVHLGIDFVPAIRPATHVPAPAHVGIAMMSKLDPSAAPEGHSTLTLISLVPFEEAQRWFPESEGGDWKAWRRSGGYEQHKKEVGDRMIAAAETVIPGLSQHIVYRTDASPVTYARYDWASAGAIYGISGEGRLMGSKSPVRGPRHSGRRQCRGRCRGGCDFGRRGGGGSFAGYAGRRFSGKDACARARDRLESLSDYGLP